jgi:hypothetical protein
MRQVKIHFSPRRYEEDIINTALYYIILYYILYYIIYIIYYIILYYMRIPYQKCRIWTLMANIGEINASLEHIKSKLRGAVYCKHLLSLNLLTDSRGTCKACLKGHPRPITIWYKKKKKTPWSESASELYRPSDRRLSAKWLPTFADRGCHVACVTDPSGRILGFLDRSR